MGTYSHVPRLNKKAQLLNQTRKKFRDILGEFFNILKDKNYRAIIIGYAVSMMASAFFTGVGLYMFTYTFKFSSTQMYLLIGSLFISTIVSQPLWAFLSRRIDKKPSLIIGMIITLLGALYIFAIFLNLLPVPREADKLMVYLFPCVVVTGIGIGSLYPLPYSMMADVIAYNAIKSKEERTATYSAFMTFAFKISQALTLLLIGVMLEAVGFKTGEGAEVYIPPLSAEIGLGYIFCLGVAVSILAGIILFSGYSLKSGDIPNHKKVTMPYFEVDRLISVLEDKEKSLKSGKRKDNA
jgi:Na+/melibiose symporter-like transporter